MNTNYPPVLLATLALAASIGLAPLPAFAGQTYNSCDDTLSGQTVTLTGGDLTLEQIVAVARHGAKVQLSPEAR
jgi:histidine ammonia-lyase